MRIRELLHSPILIALTNEEHHFLRHHKNRPIDIETLEPRESRVLENLILKDVLYKINDSQAMLKDHASQYTQRDSE
jgi:hypothetical protein